MNNSYYDNKTLKKLHGVEIEILNDTNATIKIPISEKAGKHLITLKYGDSSISKTFIIEDTKDWAIGDVIMSDGSIVKGTEIGDTDFSTKSEYPIAIIFGESLTTGKKLGVGIENFNQLNKYLFTVKSSSVLYKIPNIQCSCVNKNGKHEVSSGDVDGSDNWDELCKVDTSAILADYPAFQTALLYGTRNHLPEKYASGWYLPSCAELIMLFENKRQFKDVMYILTKKNIIKYNLESGYFSSSMNENTNNSVIMVSEKNVGPYIIPPTIDYDKTQQVLAIRAF